MTIPQHPVAMLLADMRRNRPVQKYYLSQMIDVRVSGVFQLLVLPVVVRKGMIWRLAARGVSGDV